VGLAVLELAKIQDVALAFTASQYFRTQADFLGPPRNGLGHSE